MTNVRAWKSATQRDRAPRGHVLGPSDWPLDPGVKTRDPTGFLSSELPLSHTASARSFGRVRRRVSAFACIQVICALLFCGVTTDHALPEVRRTLLTVERTYREQGHTLAVEITRVTSAAVFANPFAGLYKDDLSPLYEMGEALGARLATAAVVQLADGEVHSYGKGAIVGTNGELEHAAALLHPRLGAPLREAVGGGKSIIPSAKKRGGPGVALDVPLHHRNAAFVRSHFDAVEFAHHDAPHADELVLIVAVTDGGRPLPRVGGLKVGDIVGEDGLR